MRNKPFGIHRNKGQFKSPYKSDKWDEQVNRDQVMAKTNAMKSADGTGLIIFLLLFFVGGIIALWLIGILLGR